MNYERLEISGNENLHCMFEKKCEIISNEYVFGGF
jgi:hypothetical protein